KDPSRPGLHAGAGGLQLGLRNQHQRNAQRGRGDNDAALAAFELGRRDQVERRRRDAGAGKRIADDGADVGGGGALAASDTRDDHGLIQVHWVNGIAARQVSIRPIGSARAIATRMSSPPKPARRASSSASASSVTALTTRRPPGRSASMAASRRLASLAPPPTKTASGRASPSKAAGALPSTISSVGTPNAAALRRTRAARSPRASTDRPASIRSPPTPRRRPHPRAIRPAAGTTPTM